MNSTNSKDYESIMSSQTNKLKKSLLLINESKEIGNETLGNIKLNNEQIKDIKKTTTELNDKTKESTSILQRMSSFWRTL